MSVIGVGVDIIEVARIRASLDRHGERFHRRICTEGEAAYCTKMRDPAPFFAARFAAKEAVSKALGRESARSAPGSISKCGERPAESHSSSCMEREQKLQNALGSRG
jgi:holo-[acyl-carrier protein] synthase